MAREVLKAAPLGRRWTFGAKGRRWIIGIGLVGIVYGGAFVARGFSAPVNSLLAVTDASRGTWFSVRAKTSELFPAGYGRLEDSIPDDLGRLVLGELGQQLGLVEACETPGPDPARAIPTYPPTDVVQPRFHYAVSSMCANWRATLPAFFWRIGLVGFLALALVMGAAVYRDPLDFGILALVFLWGWSSWPEPDLERTGNVAMLVAGTPMLVLVFPLLRRGKYSQIIVWALASAIVFGVAGVLRRPCGAALLLTAALTLMSHAVDRKRRPMAIIGAIGLLAASGLVGATMNGLMAYRDTRLGINAPHIAPAGNGHGSGFALVGGVGGLPRALGSSEVAQYPNAMDIAFRDAVIWFAVHDANPLIGVVKRSYTLMQLTGLQILKDYVYRNPMEFAYNTLRKARDAVFEISRMRINWMGILVLLAFLEAPRGAARRPQSRRPEDGELQVKPILLTLALLMLVIGAPAVLTPPHYGQSAHLPAAVLLVLVVVAAHSILRRLSGGQRGMASPRAAHSVSSRVSLMMLPLFVALWLSSRLASSYDPIAGLAPTRSSSAILSAVTTLIKPGDAVLLSSEDSTLREALETQGATVVQAGPSDRQPVESFVLQQIETTCAQNSSRSATQTYWIWTGDDQRAPVQLGETARLLNFPYAFEAVLPYSGDQAFAIDRVLRLRPKDRIFGLYCAARAVAGQRSAILILDSESYSPWIRPMHTGDITWLPASPKHL
ncbi:MAG TPA: hypothetical protein VFH29_10145, partial [Anaerolineales bacterium]|nr:hypothetical protein [Anaerolineales bacterium]